MSTTTKVFFLELGDLTDEARLRFLEFFDAEESDFDTCPVAMIMRSREDDKAIVSVVPK